MLNPKEYSTTGNQEIDGVLNYNVAESKRDAESSRCSNKYSGRSIF